MKFGKQIQASQIPGWSANYLDYKFLKKIISSLAANRPASEAAALALGVVPADILNGSNTTRNESQEVASANVASILGDAPGQPPIQSATGQDDDRGLDFQAHKAAFFFKLERELEKINAFYLRKEGELKMRLETLLSKRRAAATRGLPDATDDPTQTHVEWSAVEEGFRLLERDLGKLQQFIEINGMGCRKILKKWDKHSKSSTKELYLARQVDVQPVFNRQLISELSDTVALCLLDLTDLSSGLKFEGSSAADMFSQQFNIERHAHMGPFYDLQSDLRRAIGNQDQSLIKDLVRYSDILAQEPNGGKANVTRILWKLIIEAPPDLADLILNSLTTPFDFNFVDDINGRTCLHEAAMSGTLRLVNLCLEKNLHRDKVDVYGRSPLHYAAMRGHPIVCRRLLEVKLPPNELDMDNCTPLVYATMNGSTDCVRVLLKEAPVEVGVLSPGVNLSPLSLASQAGHVDVVLLLLQHEAKSLPNSNGEYPIHLAAREGHVEVCRLLLQHSGWDVPDKYHEWTPLFHAARNGHKLCVDVLIGAGSRVNAIDELGYSPVHYAAWYGHHTCVACLLEASAALPPKIAAVTASNTSPLSDLEMSAESSDIDHIPSLSLPPPIMPHRTYGHNYLDRRFLVQVSLGFEAASDSRYMSSGPAVLLHSRLSNFTAQNHHLPASTPLKLVISAGSDANSAPYSISLPRRDEKDVFVFQIPSLDMLSLTFSIYPNFGTKTIGRAVALPSLFVGIENNSQFVLPILDHRLHVMGEVTFEVNIITPFKGVTLEVGGAVETYWKSMAVAIPSIVSQPVFRLSKSSRPTDSTGTSPSIQSVVASAGNSLTISSLKDNYIYAVVQVTRDLHPVIFADWLLPESAFNLGVADVTLCQFESLAVRVQKALDVINDSTDWRQVSESMISLSRLMTILPMGFGICLELAYPTSTIKKAHSFRHQLDLNSFVDAILRTIYHTSATLGGAYARRRIVFTSFCPDACGAVNWKQPNYPAFFASQCGQRSSITPSRTALSFEDATDHRLTCLGAAVTFSKKNNLLGVFIDAAVLIQVPSLLDAIRDAGLVVCVYGASETLDIGTEGSRVDAFLQEGMVIYKEHGF